MKEVEVKLRRGMERNQIDAETQEKIVQSIVSFALYGFPESHAASFALIAYASAYLKCRYLPAFTAALLNNEPMGFYHPATIVKDAQRHGLQVRPIDVTRSDWACKLEKNSGHFALRLGMRYVKGLREDVTQEMVSQRALRPFHSIHDLKRRVPGLQKCELTSLAEIGALNFIESPHGQRKADLGGSEKSRSHRRDALWQVERAARSAGPLLQGDELELDPEASSPRSGSPLLPMTAEERLVADFRGTGMTVGPHPMAYHREGLKKEGILSATELRNLPDGTSVRIAGSVIARQRPGTAKGFVFLSLEDETGIANAIITPQIFGRDHLVIVHQQFLVIEGKLQNQENVISVKAESIRPLYITRAETTSHDFH
jgi:error-prone DNA polymerase